MSDLRVDGQKLDLHPERLAAWRAGKDNWETAKDLFPIYVEVSPIGVCNHECTFCSVDYIIDRDDAPRLSFEVMTRTLRNMAEHGVLAAMFAGAGEPLLYRDKDTKQDLGDVILACDRFGLDTAITTNATLLTETIAEKALRAPRMIWIRTSINAGDRDTYGRIHRTKPEDFDKVVRNLEHAVRIREKLGSKVALRGQIVVVPAASGVKNRRNLALVEEFPSNIETVLPLARLLRDIGVDQLDVKPFKQHTVALKAGESAQLGETRSDMYHGELGYADHDTWGRLFSDLRSLKTDRFQVLIRENAMKQQDAEWRGYNTCFSTPYFWTYLEADGEIWGCSAHLGRFEHGKEIGDHRFRFGNVNDLSFADIWHGDRRRANWEYTRKPPSEGGLDVRCCMKGCQMDQPNVFLWKLQNDRGREVNFIK